MQPSWFSAVDDGGAVAVVRLSALMGRGRLNLPVCFTVFRGAVQRRLATREPPQQPLLWFLILGTGYPSISMLAAWLRPCVRRFVKGGSRTRFTVRTPPFAVVVSAESAWKVDGHALAVSGTSTPA